MKPVQSTKKPLVFLDMLKAAINKPGSGEQLFCIKAEKIITKEYFIRAKSQTEAERYVESGRTDKIIRTTKAGPEIIKIKSSQETKARKTASKTGLDIYV